LRPATLLLYAVGFTVAANQLFIHSGLKSRLWAYLVVQAANLALAVFAGFFPPPEFTPQVQGLVRIFLVLFSLWHGVIAFQARWNVLAEGRSKERLRSLKEFEEALTKKREEMERGGSNPEN
jgi:hypothetical protein